MIRPLLPEILGQTNPIHANFQSIFARSASAVICGKISTINTNRKSLYALSNEPMMNIVRCLWAPKGGLKTQNGLFQSKIALCLKKVCYKVSLCENCQRQSCKAFIGVSICAKMIGRGRPLLRENLADTDPPLAKRRFSVYFRS